ncbi:M48 family metalloprotease [Lyngbya aestuarii]|uniref:M48 family metalloprotease n=1 Tax=Lyngbya aestuarii TaxID=118322 RepID=UPI00403E0AF6
MNQLKKEAPSLYRILGILALRANLPMPGVYIVPSAAAKAFATGRDPKKAAVEVTKGIMRFLLEDELEVVIARELSHIYNRGTLTQAVAATVAGVIFFLAQMLSYSLWFGRDSRRRDNGANPLVLLLIVVLAPIAASVIEMAISRTREFSADAGAARLTGNPRALANALQRLDKSASQDQWQVTRLLNDC